MLYMLLKKFQYTEMMNMACVKGQKMQEEEEEKEGKEEINEEEQ